MPSEEILAPNVNEPHKYSNEDDFASMFRDVAKTYHVGVDLTRVHAIARDWKSIKTRLNRKESQVKEKLHRVERVLALEQAKTNDLVMTENDAPESHRIKMIALDAKRMETEREKEMLDDKSRLLQDREEFLKNELDDLKSNLERALPPCAESLMLALCQGFGLHFEPQKDPNGFPINLFLQSKSSMRAKSLVLTSAEDADEILEYAWASTN